MDQALLSCSWLLHIDLPPPSAGEIRGSLRRGYRALVYQKQYRYRSPGGGKGGRGCFASLVIVRDFVGFCHTRSGGYSAPIVE